MLGYSTVPCRCSRPHPSCAGGGQYASVFALIIYIPLFSATALLVHLHSLWVVPHGQMYPMLLILSSLKWCFHCSSMACLQYYRDHSCLPRSNSSPLHGARQKQCSRCWDWPRVKYSPPCGKRSSVISSKAKLQALMLAGLLMLHLAPLVILTPHRIPMGVDVDVKS